MTDFDELIALQHGAFTRGQTIVAGFPAGVIRGLLKRGDWLQICKGVYAVTADFQQRSSVDQERTKIAGRALARRHGTVSHFSAGWLHRLPFVGGWPVELIVTIDPAGGVRKGSIRFLRGSGVWCAWSS